MNYYQIWNEDDEAGYFDVDGFYTEPVEDEIPQHNLNTLFEIMFKPHHKNVFS
jgi:hypothetical protein